jgi:outer membrane immunogenic protein
MKRGTLSGLAFSLLVAVPLSAAGAADIPVKAPPAPPPPAASWTGFYVGANLGVAWGDPSQSFYQTPSSPFFPGVFTQYPPVNFGSGNVGSAAGGLQAGYNWQVSPVFLFGVEADISALSLGRQSTALVDPAPNFLSMSDNTTWLGSIRGRLGLITGSNWLIYGTGGAAWAHVTDTGFTVNPAGPANINSIITSTSKILSGWVAGGGVEYLVAQHWMLRAEYLYYGLPGRTAVAPCTACVAGAFDGSGVFTWSAFHINEVRAGVSYKF